MAYHANSDLEKPLESLYYLSMDEDCANLISGFAPAVFSILTPTSNSNDCTIIDQDEYLAVLDIVQISLALPDVKNTKEADLEQSLSSSIDLKNEASLNNESLSMQDDKLLASNESPEDHHMASDENVDILQLDDLFIAFITGESRLMEPPVPDSVQKLPSFDDIDFLNLDEFFIVDKMPHTVNDLSYHSSKDNIVDLQQDILASYMYAQYIEQYLSVMPGKTQIDEDDMDDEAVMHWADVIAYDTNSKVMQNIKIHKGVLIQAQKRILLIFRLRVC